MRHIFCAVLVAVAFPLAAATTANNDSCDIGTYPAATLLLPYFEVTLGQAGTGTTTILSITNVSASPQIARVTLWTDWAFPVISFDVFLTGYDVQPINLYDIIARGLIASPSGTSTSAPNARDSTGKSTNPNIGTTPMTNLANPNFQTSVATNCAAGRLPGQLPSALTNDMRLALSTGSTTGVSISCRTVGSNHGANLAAGYMTVDLVSTCSPAMPNDPTYWSDMLDDNVLTGDYAVIANDTTSGNYAGGNPMVHIRAVDGLPTTFYSRFTNIDKRQPLPSTFAARWIRGTGAGFDTAYTIWRDASTGPGAPCDDYSARNSAIPFDEIVRFDEHENAGVGGECLICNPPVSYALTPASSHQPVSNVIFPVITGSPDPGGWVYFNLSDRTRPARATQGWVTVSMFSEGRFGIEYDATSLGNGCSPAAGVSDTTQIGPAK